MSQREKRIDQNANVMKSGSAISVDTQSPPLVTSATSDAAPATMTVITSNWRSGMRMAAVCHRRGEESCKSPDVQ